MKITNFDKYWNELKLKSIKFRVLHKKERLFDRKPRNKQDMATLSLVHKLRWEYKLKSKQIIILNPSKYIIN